MHTYIDFAGQVDREEQGPTIRSLMDVDFYKLTMGQLIDERYRGIHVTFELINRDTNVPLATVIPEQQLRAHLDHARRLHFLQTELVWLRGMRVYQENMFSESYMRFLEGFSLSPYELERNGDQYRLAFSGDWGSVSMWETIALAIISELYYRNLMGELSYYERELLYARAKSRMLEKLQKLQGHPEVRFADFGQRRRHSFLWQEWVVQACKEMLGGQFTGTSNTLLALRYNLIPVGTNAHELPKVFTALAADSEEAMRDAQYQVVRDWQELYGEGLRVFLPDTFGTAQFLAGAPACLASDWRGMRQDSGDPVDTGWRFVRWLESHGVDPQTKTLIFSDGLDVDAMIRLAETFKGVVNTAFGWGTLLTNDFRECYPLIPLFRPFSLVCKVVEVNGRPAVKLSDNPNKATGTLEEIERYRRIFGSEGSREQEVVV